MTLQDQISQDIKKAMLAKDTVRLSTLRLLKSALGYLQIEKKVDSLPDSEVITVIQREIKKRRDSIEQFLAGGRPEQAAAETAEAAILETYLPAALSPEELEALVRSCIAELGATSKKEMGPVIKAVQAKAAGKADGKSISSLVSKLLP